MPGDGPLSHLIVIGASAGGMEALSERVSTLPEDLPAPIVIAQHLDPERESNLEEILSFEMRFAVDGRGGTRCVFESRGRPMDGGAASS